MRAAAAGLMALLALPAPAQTAAEAARAARDGFEAALAALDAAQGARDRVAALTQTISAYEAGLAVLRGTLRQAQLREAQLMLRLEAGRERTARLLGVLAQIEAQPEPLLLLHPSGPLGTARSGMILSEVAPALAAEAEALRRDLAEVADLRAVQKAAAQTLAEGLGRAQAARTALSKAVAERAPLPRRVTEDPAELAALLAGAETLEALAAGLHPLPDGGGAAGEGFAARRGALPWPARGTILRRAGEADAAGVRRPGIALATRPGALVTAPAAGTLRYLGPLGDYGNVILLEPAGDYLVVLAGVGTVFGTVGEVVTEGAPLGLMGGEDPATADFADTYGTGARETETLYIEIRRGTRPEDPAPWFAAVGERDRP